MTVYHVFANRSNVGDWLSAKGIQSLLSPLRVTELLCDEPFVPETLNRLEEAGSDDFIIIGGGGLLMDYFEPFWKGFELVSKSVPFCLWGVGCCDMKRTDSRLSAELIGPIAARSRLSVVRDELTRDFLARDVSPKVVLCPTVNVLAARPPGWGILHVDAVDNVGEAVYELMNRNGAEFAERTCRPFQTINNLIPAGSGLALTAILDRYAAADLILTGRLHGCIIGLAMGRRVLAVSGDRKVESFMSAVGLSDWILDLDQIAHLALRLEQLSEQPICDEYFINAQKRNREVAGTIQTLVAR